MNIFKVTDELGFSSIHYAKGTEEASKKHHRHFSSTEKITLVEMFEEGNIPEESICKDIYCNYEQV